MSHVCAYSGRREEYESGPLPVGMTNRGRLNQMKTPMSANKAAAEIRHKILRRISELDSWDIDKTEFVKLLVKYIRGMASRASKKKGGLGRR